MVQTLSFSSIMAKDADCLREICRLWQELWPLCSRPYQSKSNEVICAISRSSAEPPSLILALLKYPHTFVSWGVLYVGISSISLSLTHWKWDRSSVQKSVFFYCLCNSDSELNIDMKRSAAVPYTFHYSYLIQVKTFNGQEGVRI